MKMSPKFSLIPRAIRHLLRVWGKKIRTLRSHWASLGALVVIVIWAAALYRFIHLVPVRVQCQPRFQIDAAKLCVEQLPAWLLEYTQKIVPEHLPSRSLLVFDPDIVRTVACAYSQSPWVEQVVSVAKKYPNQIHVSLSLRRPLAWIVRQQRMLLCDINATRLPVESVCGQQSELPLIYGVESEMPQPGKKWRDPDLVTALQVASLLTANHALQLFPGISLYLEKQAASGKQIILVGQDPPVRIVWGESAESEFPKVSSAKRMAAVRHIHQIVQQLDASEYKKIAQFDIRFGYVIVHAKEKTWKAPNNSKRM